MVAHTFTRVLARGRRHRPKHRLTTPTRRTGQFTAGNAPTVVAAIMVVAMLLLAGAVALASRSWLAGVLTVCGLTLGAVALAVGATSVLRRERNERVSQLQALQAKVSRIEFFTERLPDVPGTVASTKELVRGVHAEVQRLGAPTPPAVAVAATTAPPEPDVAEPVAAQRPAATQAMDVTTARHGIGRLAGAGTQNPGAELQERIRPAGSSTETGLTAIAVIAPALDSSTVPPAWEVLLPSTALVQFSALRPAFLLIDGRAFASGQWRGAMDASGTRLYIQVWDVLRAAKDRGVTIALTVTDLSEGHFTEELRQQSDIIVDAGSYSVGHGEDLRIDSLDEAIGHLVGDRTPEART